MTILAIAGSAMAAAASGQQDSDTERNARVGQSILTSSAHEVLLPERERLPFEQLEGLRHLSHRMRSGDTLAKLLTRYGVAPQEMQFWIASIEKHFRPRELQVGKEIHFYFAKTDRPTGGQQGRDRLTALEIDLNGDWRLTWEKGEQGILFHKREKPYDVELKTVGGVVERSLFEDGLKAGLNSTLLSQLADIFTWEIDFARDLQKGDTFKILYEEKTRKGEQVRPSLRILAAELIRSGEKFFALYFEKKKGKGNYYDLDGRALARAFLRFPLEFTSITSYFSDSRFHPIFKVNRPHHGVDFAAKRGTVVRAVGDGVILHAGWKKGGFGRTIEIRHDSEYDSRYAHLQGFAPGIRKGVSVQKGQIIGYVGSSGRTTGTHLHFELYKDRDYIDPLTFDFPPEDLIKPASQKLFENAKEQILVELAVVPQP